MEFKEMGSVDDPKKTEEETNLEGVTEDEKSELSPKELGEKMLEERPNVKKIVEETRNEIRKEILKDDRLTEENREELLSNEDEIDKRLFDKLERKITLFYGNVYFKKMINNYFLTEAMGILDMKKKRYGRMSSNFHSAGIYDEIQPKINNLNSGEKESLERQQKLYEIFFQDQYDQKNQSFSRFRKKIENVIGKPLNELSENEIESLDMYKFYNNEEFKQIKEEYKEMQKLWNRFGGGNLSEAEKKAKDKKRKEMPKMMGKEYKEKKEAKE